LKLNVISDKYNPVFKRKEICVEIFHEKLGTPDRNTLRKNLIDEWRSKENNLYIINCKTETGTNKSICYAEIYDDAEYGKKIVPKYIIDRNFPPPTEEKKIPEEKPPKEEKPPTEEKKIPEEKPPKEETTSK